MRAWWVWLFPTWREFAAYVAILAACVSGIVGIAWWIGVFAPAVALLALGWPRWQGLLLKAAKVDADWRDLGVLAYRHGVPRWLEYFVRAHSLPAVLAVLISHDMAFSGGGYVFGMVIRWVFGVGA